MRELKVEKRNKLQYYFYFILALMVLCGYLLGFSFFEYAQPLIAPPVQERDAMPAEGSGGAGSNSDTLVGGGWIFWGGAVDIGGYKNWGQRGTVR